MNKMDQHFGNIRDNATKGYGAALTRKARGAMIGAVVGALKRLTDRLPGDEMRELRLELASDVFERSITSYNDLDDDELQALGQGVTTRRDILAKWVHEKGADRVDALDS